VSPPTDPERPAAPLDADALPESDSANPFGPVPSLIREPGSSVAPATGPVVQAELGRPITFGPVRLLVRGVALQRVRYQHEGQMAFSAEPLLMIGLALTAADPAQSVAYRTWWPTEGLVIGGATVTDQLGRTLSPGAFPPGAAVVEHVESATLTGPQVIVDLLVFEQPGPTATQLTLELPGEHVGAEGRVQVKLPWPIPSASGRLVTRPTARPAIVAKKPDAESAARAKLSMARNLRDGGQPDKAAEHLRDLIRRFPGTDAADEARDDLAQLKLDD
jgi:hypothetical protein